MMTENTPPMFDPIEEVAGGASRTSSHPDHSSGEDAPGPDKLLPNTSPPWPAELPLLVASGLYTSTELCEAVGVSSTQLKGWAESELFKSVVGTTRDEIHRDGTLARLKARAFLPSIVDKVYTTALSQLIKPEVSLKAAELLLKLSGVMDEPKASQGDEGLAATGHLSLSLTVKTDNESPREVQGVTLRHDDTTNKNTP